ncbi:GNAT family N-acetyltransferase [Nocardioides daeguensis]|uniref:N-acetyltransferase domain-containing protein n=1 Tax=Nocardioides daeguensis TaxID=908359 RepID=A0ABP6UUG1_9ACTN|nr:GNAT family N-acetyltransferase [Nocardioides daeguensis]MBV6725672.1 GNAT family N-acetyltransferase [Nocardioides daeguensis]MCR1772813.1 GNAT family N-acetyltransferase [Nocardioides daeguensis]
MPTDPGGSAGLLLRPARADDVPAIAAVQLAARAASPMPPGIHPPHEVRAHLAARLGDSECWVAESGGGVVGYARFTRTWLDDLYVDPAHQGTGVGGALLDLVKVRHPDGFSLWVFEQNAPARAFYAARGLVEREHTDGSENEERAPDLRMEWAPGSVGGSA